MKRVLRVYLQNIFKQKTYYICAGISILIGVVLPFVLSLFIKSEEAMTFGSRLVSSFKLDIVIIIFITLFTCSDFTDGTSKNFIARGYTRRQLLYGKYFACLIAVGVFFVACALLTFVFFAKDGISFGKSDFLMIIAALVTATASIGLYVIMANTAEKVSTGMMINILLYSFAGLLFTGIESLLKLDFSLSNYWVSGLNGLMPENAGFTDLLLVVGVALVYLVLLFELSNFIIKKKEVK